MCTSCCTAEARSAVIHAHARHRLEFVAEARLRQQAPVPHPDDLGQAEALPQFVQLRSQGHRIGGIALKDLDGHGAALSVTQQAKDNLPLVSLAITRMANVRSGACPPFKVGGGDITEYQGPCGQMPSGQVFFKARLAFQQPIHRMIELIGSGGLEAEFFASGRRQRVSVKPACGGQFGLGVEEPGHDHRDDEGAFAARSRGNHPFEPTAAKAAQDRRHVPMGPGADDLKRRIELVNGCPPA